MLFPVFRRLLVVLTGHGYDRSAWMNDLHHKLAYRLHKMLPRFGIRGVQKISISSNRHLYVHAEDGGVGHQWIMYGQYEPYETSLVKQYIRPGMTVYNIGANIGYYTLLASDCVGPSGFVYAFEPAAENLELLNRTVSENQLANVRVLPIAVGISDGVATLELSSTNSGYNQVMSGRRGDRASTDVGLRSVDSLIAERLPQPNAIIMDVQGSELDVLRGMTEALANKTLTVIFTEFWPGGLNARHPDGAREFIERLQTSGFRFSRIDEKRKEIHTISKEELLTPRPDHEELNLLCQR
jgi:FkbM family methyltransferase